KNRTIWLAGRLAAAVKSRVGKDGKRENRNGAYNWDRQRRWWDHARLPDPAFPGLCATARNWRRVFTDRRIGAFELRIADRLLNQASCRRCQPPRKQAWPGVTLPHMTGRLQRGRGGIG